MVVPVLNESEALPTLIEEIETACDSLGGRYEAIVVDDGSTDGTAELLEQMVHDHPLRLVKLRRNYGKAAALKEGFRQTRGRVVVTLDGDGQDDPAEIPALVLKLGEDYDRRSRGGSAPASTPPAAARAPRFFNGATAAPARRQAPRLQLRPEGLPRRPRAIDRPLRRAAPLHPRDRHAARLARDRDAGQSPVAPVRQLAIRPGAL